MSDQDMASMSPEANHQREPVAFAEALSRPTVVETPLIRRIVERALTYLRCGLAVHFSGPAGTGKTTLALHVAGMLGRPVSFIQGDDEVTTSDLLGGIYGYRRARIVDNYVRSVLKTEEDISERWTDNRLTIACRRGYTLLYDEFTRSHPEANNVLLSVLEERLLTLPAPWNLKGYISVHPDFRAIFTSNPEEYAGVHRAQDALRDRMVTIFLDQYDDETETAIVAARSGLDVEEARVLVRMVRALREREPGLARAGLRAGITLATVVKRAGIPVYPPVDRFREVFCDVFSPSGTAEFSRLETFYRTVVMPGGKDVGTRAEGQDGP